VSITISRFVLDYFPILDMVTVTVFETILKFGPGGRSVMEQFLGQSGRQVAASGGRPIVWIFAESEAALFARKLFDTAKEGRESIHVVHMPWTRGRRDE